MTLTGLNRVLSLFLVNLKKELHEDICFRGDVSQTNLFDIGTTCNNELKICSVKFCFNLLCYVVDTALKSVGDWPH